MTHLDSMSANGVNPDQTRRELPLSALAALNTEIWLLWITAHHCSLLRVNKQLDAFIESHQLKTQFIGFPYTDLFNTWQ